MIVKEFENTVLKEKNLTQEATLKGAFRIQLRVTEAKNSPLLLWHIFVSFTEKESCIKFCGILIRFHEVIKLHTFGFSVRRSYLRITKHFTSIFGGFFFRFMEKKLQ